jgi:hypothetical protein
MPSVGGLGASQVPRDPAIDYPAKRVKYRTILIMSSMVTEVPYPLKVTKLNV